jgi:hypothetical protein
VPTAFTYRYEPLAALEHKGVAHWSVGFAHPSLAETRVEVDGILVLNFDDEGRCTEHREWYSSRDVPAHDRAPFAAGVTKGEASPRR